MLLLNNEWWVLWFFIPLAHGVASVLCHLVPSVRALAFITLLEHVLFSGDKEVSLPSLTLHVYFSLPIFLLIRLTLAMNRLTLDCLLSCVGIPTPMHSEVPYMLPSFAYNQQHVSSIPFDDVHPIGLWAGRFACPIPRVFGYSTEYSVHAYPQRVAALYALSPGRLLMASPLTNPAVLVSVSMICQFCVRSKPSLCLPWCILSYGVHPFLSSCTTCVFS